LTVQCVYVIRTIWPNSEGCFWCHKTAFSRQERIFLKTKKADQKHCENWRRESGSEFHKTAPTCERGDWRKQLQLFEDFVTQSLKQTPLGSCAISRLFWPDAYEVNFSFLVLNPHKIFLGFWFVMLPHS